MAKKQIRKSKAKQPRGNVGERIFAAVEKLTVGGKMKRGAALREVAKASKANVGTVSANYYRIARKRGVKLQPRRRRRRGGRVASAGRKATRVRSLAGLISSLERLVREQARELAALQKENRRFAAVRRLLGA